MDIWILERIARYSYTPNLESLRHKHTQMPGRHAAPFSSDENAMLGIERAFRGKRLDRLQLNEGALILISTRNKALTDPCFDVFRIVKMTLDSGISE